MPPKSAKKGKGGPQNTPATKGKAKIAVPMDESDSEESSEEDEPPPVVKAIGSAKKTKAAAKQQEPSDEDSEDLEEDYESEEEEEEEEEEKKPMVGNKRKLPQQKVQPPKMAAKGNKKQKADSEDEEDSDEDEDESEESEDEPVVDLKKPNKFQQTKAKVNGKQAQKAAAAEESSEDEEDEEDEESEEEEPEEESEEEVKEKKKNKESVKATNAVAEGVITLFCGNLKDDCGPKELGKLFKKNGIEIADVRKNVGKRFGLVDLANASQLDAALALNQTTFQDQEIKVELSRSSSGTTGTPKPSKTPKTPKKSQNEDCSLFVKNLADSVTEKTLKEFFSEAVEIRILKRPDGKSKGMAFIDFKDASVVETMMKKHQGAELEGQALYLDRARQKGAFKSPRESVKSRVLFVGNLSFSVTDDQLVDTFEGALSARIPTNPEGKPKGFAFIDFETVEAAQEAYDKWQGQDLEGREIKIDWAHEKGDRGRSPGGHFGGRGRGRGNFRGGRGDRGGGRGGRGGRGGGRGFGRGGGGRGGFGDKRKSSDFNFGSENKRVKMDADSD